MKKILIFLIAGILFLLPMFGCAEKPSGNEDNNQNQTQPGGDGQEEEPKMHEWNAEPVVTRTFYDDFSEGIRPDVWDVATGTWDKVSNGLVPENVFYSTYEPRVEAEGATGGMAIIQSNGDFAYESVKRRQGGLMITKKAYGAGLYEARVKVVPRSGQCTALWTYWTNNAATLANNRCSEIDIELPNAASFREWGGTIYSRYIDKSNKVSDGEVYETAPLNDGEWHTMAFEWRTKEETGDKAVVYYVDGREVGMIEGDAVPVHTATYWIASRFPDSVGWLGDPQYETAYMYIDWVRITEYDDPVEKGEVDDPSVTGPTGTDLGTGFIPETNYISNSQFVQDFTVKNMKNADITSWTTENAEKGSNCAVISPDGKISQVVTSQYEGFSFNLEVMAEVTGSGKCKVYVEFLSGAVNTVSPKFRVVGRTEVMEFSAADGKATKNADFTVGGGKDVQSIRVVLETESGATAKISQVRMFLN